MAARDCYFYCTFGAACLFEIAFEWDARTLCGREPPRDRRSARE